MSDTTKRDQVFRLAATDAKAALKKARLIEDAWFRVQALAALIRQPQAISSNLVSEAENAANGEADRYRAVAPMAWVVAALVESGRNTDAKKLLSRLRLACKSITPNTSQANAIVLLLQASHLHDDQTENWTVESLKSLVANDQDKRIRSALKQAQQIINGKQPFRVFFS